MAGKRVQTFKAARKPPERKTTLSLYLTAALVDAIRSEADRDRRSMSDVVQMFMERALEVKP